MVLESVKVYFYVVEQMFQGTHYLGLDMVAQFEEGETWKKVFGPIFIYLNSTPDTSKAHNLWTDAKKQVLIVHLRLAELCYLSSDSLTSCCCTWLILEAV